MMKRKSREANLVIHSIRVTQTPIITILYEKQNKKEKDIWISMRACLAHTVHEIYFRM